MKTKTVVADENPTGNGYSAKEIKIINSIIKHQDALVDKTLKTGEDCDRFVKISGGILYRDKTMSRIAKYPGITCSEQHLRHCWGFYRLMTNAAYSNDNLKTLRNKPSAVFPLCAIMDSEMEEAEKVKLLEEVEAKAVKEKLSVRDILKLVSTELEERGLGRKKKDNPPKPSGPTEVDSAIKCEKQFQEYDFKIRAVVKSKDLITKVLSTQKKCNDIVGRFKNHVDLVEKIPDCYRNEEVKKQMKDIAGRLMVIAAARKQ